jgi:transposase
MGRLSRFRGARPCLRSARVTSSLCVNSPSLPNASQNPHALREADIPIRTCSSSQTGYSGKHRAVGTKLSLLVDRAGTPIAVSVAPGNYHDGGLGFLTVANIYKPPPILRDILPDAAKTTEVTLLADKGYDSLRFRQFVHEHGYWPLIPTRSCIPAAQAVGELYAEDVKLQRKRYVFERTLGWLKGFRRLRYRVDRTAASFQAFVYLEILVLCVRRLITRE